MAVVVKTAGEQVPDREPPAKQSVVEAPPTALLLNRNSLPGPSSHDSEAGAKAYGPSAPSNSDGEIERWLIATSKVTHGLKPPLVDVLADVLRGDSEAATNNLVDPQNLLLGLGVAGPFGRWLSSLTKGAKVLGEGAKVAGEGAKVVGEGAKISQVGPKPAVPTTSPAPTTTATSTPARAKSFPRRTRVSKIEEFAAFEHAYDEMMKVARAFVDSKPFIAEGLSNRFLRHLWEGFCAVRGGFDRLKLHEGKVVDDFDKALELVSLSSAPSEIAEPLIALIKQVQSKSIPAWLQVERIAQSKP